MNLKGQGALEYLLLIGGAVLVAAIVIALVTGIPGTAVDPADSAYCASLTAPGGAVCTGGCPPSGTGACVLNADNVCYYDMAGNYPVTCT